MDEIKEESSTDQVISVDSPVPIDKMLFKETIGGLVSYDSHPIPNAPI